MNFVNPIRLLCLIFLLFAGSIINVKGDTQYVLTPGELTPSAVKQAPLELTLNVTNRIQDDLFDAYLNITVPENWTALAATPLDIESTINGVSRINIPLLEKNSTLILKITFVPLCDAATQEPISISYELFDSNDSSLSAYILDDILLSSPTANFINGYYPDEIIVIKGKETERTWGFVQTTAYVKDIRIEIICESTSLVEFHKISFKDRNDQFVDIDLTENLTQQSDRYFLHISGDIINQITGTDELTSGTQLILKEEIVYNGDCGQSSEMTYNVYYGSDETDWCRYLQTKSKIAIMSYGFYPWIEFTTKGAAYGATSSPQVGAMLQTYPTGSDGSPEKRGKRILRVANAFDSQDEEAGILRDILIKIQTNPSYKTSTNNAYIKVYRAYFSDAAGVPLAGTLPDIPVTQGTGIEGEQFVSGTWVPNAGWDEKLNYSVLMRSYQHFIRFDLLKDEGFAGSASVPLVSYDDDENYNDLPKGKFFYITYEYDIQYLDDIIHFQFDPDKATATNPSGTPDVSKQRQVAFMTFHRTMVDLYYRNSCNTYVGYGYSSASASNGFTSGDTGNYPNLLKDGADPEKVYGAPSNIAETVINAGLPIITSSRQVTTTSYEDKKNINPGEKTLLRVQLPSLNTSFARTGYLVSNLNTAQGLNYEHNLYVTLPEGFEYDPDYGVNIRTTATENTGSLRNVSVDFNYGAVDVSEVDDNGRRIVKIRNKTYFVTNAWIYIGMKDTNDPDYPDTQPREDKNVDFEFYFNMKGEAPVKYAYYTVPLDYNQLFPCSRIQLSEFVSERTTYGYKDKSMSELYTSPTAGMNLKAAGPYDNVSHIARLKIKDDIDFIPGDKFKVELSFKGEDNPYFIFPDDNGVAVLRYQTKLNEGTSVFEPDIVIPVSNLTSEYQNSYYRHTLDLTPYVNDQIFLNEGDSIIVEFRTKTTKLIPNAATLITDLKMEAYTERTDENGLSVSSCGPRSTDFKLFNYILAGLVGTNSVYEYNTGAGEFMRWQLNNNSSSAEVFTNEFRPNSIFDSIKVEMNGLFLVDRLHITGTSSEANTSIRDENSNIGYSSMTTVDIPADYYTLHYEEGKTLLTIYNKRMTDDDPSAMNMEAEFYANYGNGYYIFADMVLIGASKEDMAGTNSNVQRMHFTVFAEDYPTSLNPERRLVENTYYVYNSGSFNFYKCDVNIIAVAGPVSAEVKEWELYITNKSGNYDGAGGILPNSWLALETAEGVLDEIHLYDESDNLVGGIDPENPDGQFITYADGKYWIKMGDLEIRNSNSKKFKIKATYKACSGGVYPISAVYGLANRIYPESPWTGYDEVYNTSIMLNTVELTPTSIQVPTSGLTGLVKGSNPDEIGDDDLYTMCEPFTVDAVFINTGESPITNLNAKLFLRNGLEFNHAYNVEMKIGSGTFTTLDNSVLNFDEASRVLITLPVDVILGAYGSQSDSVTIRFQMLPECGFDGRRVYLQISGENVCRDIIQPITIRSEKDFPIISTPDKPYINIENVLLNDSPVMAGAAIPVAYDPANDGKITLDIKYKWDLKVSDRLYAYIEFPEDLDLDITNSFLEDSQELYGRQSFEYISTTTSGVKLIKAKFDLPLDYDFSSAVEYNAKVILSPQNSNNWDCEEYSIESFIGLVSEVTCNENPCDILEIISTATSNFEYVKLKDLEITVLGTYANNTQEKLQINGKIQSNLAGDFNFDLKMKLGVQDNNGKYTVIDYYLAGAEDYFVASLSNLNPEFSVGPYNINYTDICNLVLLILKEDNDYLCEDILIPLGDKITLNIAQNDYTICQYSDPFEVGDLPIGDYKYVWTVKTSPAGVDALGLLSNPNISQPSFTPSAGGYFEYIIDVERSGGCVYGDTLRITVNEAPRFTVSPNNLCGIDQYDLSTLVVNETAEATIRYYSSANATAESEISPLVILSTDVQRFYIKSIHDITGCESLIEEVAIAVNADLIWSPQQDAAVPEEDKRDWNNKLNWKYAKDHSAGMVPLECSNVYIPGNVDYFPYLGDDTPDLYFCNNIYFMHGAEVGQLQRLNYQFAHVQLNVGLTSQTVSHDYQDHLSFSAQNSSTPLSRHNWHMLTAPLDKMVTGDFAFGGFPATFLKKFDAARPDDGNFIKGNWSDFYSHMNEELKPGEGFILWINEARSEDMYRESGSGDDGYGLRDYGIKEVNGIMEFPFYEKADMSSARRIHANPQENVSQFFYIHEYKTDPEFMKVSAINDTYHRGSNKEAYRLHTGKYQYQVTVDQSQSNKIALVGNPYMSTIDFEEFYLLNSSYIKPNYQIWTGTGFSSYSSAGSSGSSGGDLDQYISPMQSFLVELNEEVNSDFTLEFDPEKLSAVRPVSSVSKLRSVVKKSSLNKLEIEAVNSKGAVVTYITQDDAGKGMISNKDSRKIISAIYNQPEIYTLKRDDTGEGGLGSNFINADEQVIPLGVATSWNGEIEFRFKGMNNYDAFIWFIDMQNSNPEMEITGLKNFEYRYTHSSLKNSSNNYVPVEDRFFIHIIPYNTDDITNEDDVFVYNNEQGINILSHDKNMIEEVYLYDMQGKLLYADNSVKDKRYTIHNLSVPQVCVAKILTTKGVKNVKVISK